MNLDDICTNYKHVKLLANIHESLDWLYCKLLYYFDILDKCLNDTKYLDALTQTTGKILDLILNLVNLETSSNLSCRTVLYFLVLNYIEI